MCKYKEIVVVSGKYSDGDFSRGDAYRVDRDPAIGLVIPTSTHEVILNSETKKRWAPMIFLALTWGRRLQAAAQ